MVPDGEKGIPAWPVRGLGQSDQSAKSVDLMSVLNETQAAGDDSPDLKERDQEVQKERENERISEGLGSVKECGHIDVAPSKRIDKTCRK